MANGFETNPLTETHFQQLSQAQEQLTALESLIQKSKMAGLDVTQHEQTARDLKARILRIKQAFFPGR